MNAVAQCELNPIHDQIIFEFVESTRHGKFDTKSKGGLFILETADKQVDVCRWVRILAMGPEVVDADYTVGDIVLVEKLRWTTMFKVTLTEYWITTATEILAIWDDPDNLPV